ncbi:hypothetical protein [Streptomyces sp. SID2888]|uniref:hypothetical protein n=1 Tax=Streptomyces sp. SID2888 TaxID=2690256 RepID=UPI001369A047|nr:hypothetical protein [Streptomyces sp. SID2888]MYV46202.1 hypothetical protein [Streptomyces sp. SID2888]
MIDWAALLGGALFGFLGGMVAAWRIASVEAAKAWAGDLRHRFKVKQADREKTQQLRHARLDDNHQAELQRSEAERNQAEKARENERRRIKRAHSELKKSLQTANESVGTYTTALFINMLKGEMPPETILEEINKLDRHRLLLKELQGHLETLSGLGISINHRIKDWRDPLQDDLRELAKAIASTTEEYAKLLSQHQGGS